MDLLSTAGPAEELIERLRTWLALPESASVPALVVETSGSTGQPKRVVLSRAAVLASVRASAARLGDTGPWVLALPSSYVAGVQVIVRSLVAGFDPVLLERDGWPSGPGWFVSLVPTQLQRFLDSPDDLAALRRSSCVLLGGGPVGTVAAAARGEGLRVVTTYGSAETAGGCVYDGLPLDGVALAIDAAGRVRVGGPTLFSGYDGAPELTAEVLVDGWFLTSDAGRIDEDGHLRVLGRIDDVIVSGGLNIPGPAVAARLREHPDVEAAEVLGVADDEWGSRVVAFVVPRVVVRVTPGSLSQLRDELRGWVAEVHPRAWAPRQLVVLDEIPELANGKPDRLRLRTIAEEAVR